MKTVSSKWPELVVSTPKLHEAFASRNVKLSDAIVYSVTSVSSMMVLAYRDEAPTCIDPDRGDIFDVDTPLPKIAHDTVAVIVKSPSASSAGVEVHGVVYSQSAGLAVVLVRWGEGEPIDITLGYDANVIGYAGFYGEGVNGLLVHSALQCVAAATAVGCLPTFEDRHMTKKYKGLGLSARPHLMFRAPYRRGRKTGRARSSVSHVRGEHERLFIAYADKSDRIACKHWVARGYDKYSRKSITGEAMAKLADRGRPIPGPEELVFIKSMTIAAVEVTSSLSPSTPATTPGSPPSSSP